MVFTCVKPAKKQAINVNFLILVVPLDYYGLVDFTTAKSDKTREVQKTGGNFANVF